VRLCSFRTLKRCLSSFPRIAVAAQHDQALDAEAVKFDDGISLAMGTIARLDPDQAQRQCRLA
jgi:hypothetical protein